MAKSSHLSLKVSDPKRQLCQPPNSLELQQARDSPESKDSDLHLSERLLWTKHRTLHPLYGRPGRSNHTARVSCLSPICKRGVVCRITYAAYWVERQPYSVER